MATKEKQLMEDVKRCMVRVNRPMSTQMVADALTQSGNKQGKTGVQKALDSLVESGEISEKTYGKAKIYYPNQSSMPEATPDELKRMEQTVVELRQSVSTESASASALDAALRKLNQRVNVADAKADIAELEKELPELEKRLAAAKAASGGITPEEQQMLNKKYDLYVSTWRKRKAICMNAVNQIYENCDKSKKDLMRSMGLELDDDVEAMLPAVAR